MLYLLNYTARPLYFEAGATYIGHAGLELLILLPQGPEDLELQTYVTVPRNRTILGLGLH